MYSLKEQEPFYLSEHIKATITQTFNTLKQFHNVMIDIFVLKINISSSSCSDALADMLVA